MSYKVSFKNTSEIRMGSAYNGAEIVLSGGFIPELGEVTFQDKFLLAEDGQVVFLVHWDSDKGNPGFIVTKVNNRNKTATSSIRITGCCDKIFLDGGQVMVNSFIYPNMKTVKVVVDSWIVYRN